MSELKSKQLKKFVTKFYIYKLFTLMGFIIPFIAIMLDRNGLTATQIAICIMAQQAVQFITEIPSGVLADRYSRRNVLIASQLVTVGAYAFWLAIKGFMRSVGIFATLFIFGKIVDYFQSYRIGFLTFAYLFTIGTFGFLVIFWRDKHLRKKEERLR